jgi:hypothetical protein
MLPRQREDIRGHVVRGVADHPIKTAVIPALGISGIGYPVGIFGGVNVPTSYTKAVGFKDGGDRPMPYRWLQNRAGDLNFAQKCKS